MSPILAGVALAVTAGAVIAVSAREARAAFIGLAVALGLGPFLADPLPGAAILGARVVTAVLVVVLLRAVATADAGGGSRTGWPAQAMLAASAAIAGIAVAIALEALDPGGPGRPASGSPFDSITPRALALAAGAAALVLGAAPALLGRRALGAAIGLLLAIHGVVLVQT
ncbi:MAG TPA: hypothetical protein VFX65_07595, partial [Candidatus Limnocylindrales bacterium]|nr:hypothetical protein [Candidatus Limnocylindrales bacterium]